VNGYINSYVAYRFCALETLESSYSCTIFAFFVEDNENEHLIFRDFYVR